MKKVKTTCVRKSKGLESFHKIPLFAKQSITSTSSETYNPIIKALFLLHRPLIKACLHHNKVRQICVKMKQSSLCNKGGWKSEGIVSQDFPYYCTKTTPGLQLVSNAIRKITSVTVCLPKLSLGFSKVSQ